MFRSYKNVLYDGNIGCNFFLIEYDIDFKNKEKYILFVALKGTLMQIWKSHYMFVFI